jgi:hypothetical protein
MDAEQLMAELIEALRELRVQVIQIGAGERGVREDLRLSSQLMTVLATFHRLSTIRTPPANVANLPEMIRVMEQDRALAEALQVINPDYAVEAIDTAIGVATSQRLNFPREDYAGDAGDAADVAMDDDPTDWGGGTAGSAGDPAGWGGDEPAGWGGDEQGP